MYMYTYTYTHPHTHTQTHMQPFGARDSSAACGEAFRHLAEMVQTPKELLRPGILRDGGASLELRKGFQLCRREEQAESCEVEARLGVGKCLV